ncbi:hypothetical protein CEXT_809941 [Caerostris extrusa]|uniref:Uncharacterized protein n=1 Tax=Caerostris extrusa TaxID=172846 RepID=A0AAV4XBQ1_CAEEX|nr:hypothetical protein CEXT_809941 [Caerostris extrusa]
MLSIEAVHSCRRLILHSGTIPYLRLENPRMPFQIQQAENRGCHILNEPCTLLNSQPRDKIPIGEDQKKKGWRELRQGLPTLKSQYEMHIPEPQPKRISPCSFVTANEGKIENGGARTLLPHTDPPPHSCSRNRPRASLHAGYCSTPCQT